MTNNIFCTKRSTFVENFMDVKKGNLGRALYTYALYIPTIEKKEISKRRKSAIDFDTSNISRELSIRRL